MNDRGAGWDCHVHVFDASVRTQAGHYEPVDRPLAQIERVAAAQEVHHLVLVQPSVYGTDNTLLLRALGVTPGRHRGVVVVDDSVEDRELDAMHAVGVRGVRLNLVSPVGERSDVSARFAAIAPRLRRRGWHLQWYVRPQHLPKVAALHRDSGITCVLDHLGGFGTGIAADHPAWKDLRTLAEQGAWMKLSGWYRLDASEPYPDLLPHVSRVAELFGERVVWGSDWPHTMFAPEAMPAYASTWQPVPQALGEAMALRLRHRMPAIYQ